MAIAVPYLMENCHLIVRRGKLKRKTIGAKRLAGSIIQDAITAAGAELADNYPLNLVVLPVPRTAFTDQYGNGGTP